MTDYREHSTDVSVHFDLELVAGKMNNCLATPGGLPAKFKLNTKISTGGDCGAQVAGPAKRVDIIPRVSCHCSLQM